MPLREGNVAAVRELFAQCLEIRRTLGDQWSIADSLEAYAALASVESRPLDAARLCGAAEAVREAIGALLPTGERRRHEQDVTAARAQSDDASFAGAWAEGRALSPAQAVALAQDMRRE